MCDVITCHDLSKLAHAIFNSMTIRTSFTQFSLKEWVKKHPIWADTRIATAAPAGNFDVAG